MNHHGRGRGGLFSEFHAAPRKPTVEHRRTFGQDLKRVREARRISLHDCAHITRASEADVLAWEADEKIPSRAELGRLCQAMNSLRSWKNALHTAPDIVLAAMTDTPPEEPRTSANMITVAMLADTLPDASDAPLRFGPALAGERLAARLTEDEIAKLVGVTGQAVSHWETENNAPIQAHYDALVSLFPNLALAAKPSCRDIDKPSGGAGIEREAPPVAEPAPPPVAASEPTAPMSFGKALASERVKAGLERLDLAQRLSVSRRVVQGWELDERIPVDEHLARLLAEFPALTPPPSVPVPPPAPTPEGKAETFGKALQREREHAGLHRTDLAAELGLSHWTVQTWEHDRWPPKPAMHDRLVKMFPALASAPSPRPGDPKNPPKEPADMANPALQSVPVIAPAPSNIGGMISLLSAVRRVEGSADLGKMLALLREADRAGVTVADLARLLTPEAP